LVFSIICCAISRCASEGERLVFTKDWIMVMSDENTLSSKF
jgi:hypothetical protein